MKFFSLVLVYKVHLSMPLTGVG